MRIKGEAQGRREKGNGDDTREITEAEALVIKERDERTEIQNGEFAKEVVMREET